MTGRRAQEDVRDIIDRVMDAMRSKPSSHFSEQIYRDEPIITTGRQMARYLPDEYREMRRISRWEEGEGGSRGRWLSESEHFYRQASFMEGFEDDCPYHGDHRASAPTYSTMSDRQLRGYFTWRAAARRGEACEAPAAFAYTHAYELLCGIGASDPLDGYRRLVELQRIARTPARGLAELIDSWLPDYVAYHALDPRLVEDSKETRLDRKLIALRQARAHAEEALRAQVGQGRERRKRDGMPPLGEAEGRLLRALDDLATDPISNGAFYQSHSADVDHVACAAFLGLAEHCDKHRKTPFLADWFGEPVELPHTMFASAVFFEPERHPDADVQINAVRSYRCRDGRWTCARIRGGGRGGLEISNLLHAVVQRMEGDCGEAADARRGREDPPKYLRAIIDREVGARLAWREAHAPRSVAIDLSKLAGIRSSAAVTREALLVDEEREEGGSIPPADGDSGSTAHQPPHAPDAPCPRAEPAGAEADSAPRARARAEVAASAPPPPRQFGGEQSPWSGMLDEAQAAFLLALLEGRGPAAGDATADMMADAVNEAFLEPIGDTVVEFGEDGPRFVEDYREDVEGLM